MMFLVLGWIDVVGRDWEATVVDARWRLLAERYV
jgi:hypothetical protein